MQMNKWERESMRAGGRSHLELDHGDFNAFAGMLGVFLRMGLMSPQYYREVMIIPMVRDKARM